MPLIEKQNEWELCRWNVNAVPRKVLKERYEEPTLEDEMTSSGVSRDANDYDEFDGYESIDDFFRESAAFSPPPNADSSSVGNVTRSTAATPPAKDQNSGEYLYACSDFIFPEWVGPVISINATC